MEVKIQMGDIDEEVLGELLIRKAEEAGLVMVAPERQKPYSVPEVAEAVGLSVVSIRSEIADKKWPTLPFTGRILIPAWAVRVRQAGGEPMKEKKALERKGYLKAEDLGLRQGAAKYADRKKMG